MTKEMHERLIKAFESYNERHGVTDKDLSEIYNGRNTITDEEALQYIWLMDK